MTILRTSGRLIVSNEAQRNAGVAQWLERHVANVNVVGSNPITRSLNRNARSMVYERFFRGFLSVSMLDGSATMLAFKF